MTADRLYICWFYTILSLPRHRLFLSFISIDSFRGGVYTFMIQEKPFYGQQIFKRYFKFVYLHKYTKINMYKLAFIKVFTYITHNSAKKSHFFKSNFKFVTLYKQPSANLYSLYNKKRGFRLFFNILLLRLGVYSLFSTYIRFRSTP